MNLLKEVVYRSGYGPTYLNYWWKNRFKGNLKNDWCEKNMAFFVHIPKTAGTSLINALGIEFTGYTHCPATVLKEIYPKEFEQYFSFSVVRNPFDKFVSSFDYVTKHTDWREQQEWAKKYISGATLPEFVSELISRRSYRNLILGNEFFLSQTHFIDDVNGNRLVKQVLKFENIASEYASLMGRFPNAAPLPHARKVVTRKPFQEYYDNRTEQFVRQHYSSDFSAFGYNAYLDAETSVAI